MVLSISRALGSKLEAQIRLTFERRGRCSSGQRASSQRHRFQHRKCRMFETFDRQCIRTQPVRQRYPHITDLESAIVEHGQGL
jgi:hypothetical protein